MIGLGIGSTGRREGERSFDDVRADVALFAEMPKIAAQAVGDINGGGGEAVLDEPLTFGNAGGRPLVPSQQKPAVRRLQGRMTRLRRMHEESEAGMRIAQRPGHKEGIADAGTAPEQGLTGFDDSGECDAEK